MFYSFCFRPIFCGILLSWTSVQLALVKYTHKHTHLYMKTRTHILIIDCYHYRRPRCLSFLQSVMNVLCKWWQYLSHELEPCYWTHNWAPWSCISRCSSTGKTIIEPNDFEEVDLHDLQIRWRKRKKFPYLQGSSGPWESSCCFFKPLTFKT